MACSRCARFVHGVLKAEEDVALCVAEERRREAESNESLIEMSFLDEETTARQQLQILQQRLTTDTADIVVRGKKVSSVDDLVKALGPDPPAVTTASTSAASASAASASAASAPIANPVEVHAPLSSTTSVSSTSTASTLTPEQEAPTATASTTSGD